MIRLLSRTTVLSLVLAVRAAGNDDSGSPPCPTPPCAPAPRKIVVEVPPPQVVFEAAPPIQRCCHTCGHHHGATVVAVPTFQATPTFAVQSFAPQAVAAPQFTFAPQAIAAPQFSIAPQAIAAPQFTIAPPAVAAPQFTFTPQVAGPQFTIIPQVFTPAAPNLAQLAQAIAAIQAAQPLAGNSPQGAPFTPQAAAATAADSRLDNALIKISTSLSKLQEITDMQTDALREHQRRIKILEAFAEGAAKPGVATPAMNAELKAILDAARAANPPK